MSKAVINSKDAEKSVLDFIPPKFELGAPEQARAYLETRAQGQSFRMSETVRIQTGVKDIETTSFDERVEQRTLERLKDVQEAAYQEAYQLGLEEGKHEAFQKASAEIIARLENLDTLILSISKLKTEMFQFNESHIVQLTLHVASRLAHAEVKADPAGIAEIVRSALEMAQSEEQVTVQVAPSQYEFLETLKKETAREFEFLKKVRIEPADDVTEGGCVVESNYGEIDSRFEERVSRLWETMSENLYRVKDKISAA